MAGDRGSSSSAPTRSGARSGTLQDAVRGRVRGFLLDGVRMAAERHVAAVRSGRAEVPRALVADLVADAVEPGVDHRVGDGLDLLMARHVDLRVRVQVVGELLRAARRVVAV